MDQKIVTIFGFPPLKEEFYGWQLSFHHKLDLNNALLYRGNGQIIDLKTQIPIVQNVIEFIELEDLPISITSNEQNMIYVGTNSAVYEIDLRLEKVNKLNLYKLEYTDLHYSLEGAYILPIYGVGAHILIKSKGNFFSNFPCP